VSDPLTLDEGSLRQRLQAALSGGFSGSLYLSTLACAYLASEEDRSEPVIDVHTEEDSLYLLLLHQAEVEQVDATRLVADLTVTASIPEGKWS